LQPLVSEFKGHDRAGSLDVDQVAGQKVNVISNKRGMVKCSYTDYYDHNVLLPNGDVLICCMDYGKKHVFGNLITNGYYDLFQTKEYGKLVSANMNPNNSESGASICRKCERVCNAR
jgi:hypothetical protein